MNWPNLMLWLEAYYNGTCRRPAMNRNGSCVVSLFEVIKKLDECHMNWAGMKAVLNDIRMTLGTQHVDWLIDGSK